MTPRDEQLFLQGMLLGAAMLAYQQQQELALIDQRLQRVEGKLRPALRILQRLVPAGRRDGQRVYRIAGQN